MRSTFTVLFYVKKGSEKPNGNLPLMCRITVVLSDNLTNAMTGGPDSAGTNKFEAICLGLGVEPEHVRVVAVSYTHLGNAPNV